MGFKKGESGNPSGRPLGTPNRTTGRLREVITEFLEDRFEDVVKDFAGLEPKDRIKVYTDLLQYGLPKLQAISNKIEFENLTNEQLDVLYDNLLKTPINGK